jgi:release factor glutamine methyltransferase
VTERLDALRARLRQEAFERGANPRDVDVLLADALGRSVTWLFAHGEEPVDEEIVRASLDRRLAGEPLQYIRGRTEFYSREYLVDDRVLIPRPETELLVEQVLQRAPRNGRVIDVGTGSGCIAISIERERPDLHVSSVDISVSALALASVNRARLGSAVRLAASDVLSAVRGTFDIIVSNPPYIAEGAVAHLAPEVRDHEPWSALTSGPSGTEVIARLLEEGRPMLAPGGAVMMEIGYGQESAVRSLAATRGYGVERVLPDLAGIPRIVILQPA